VFTYRAERPRKTYQDSWGRFSVHYLNDQGTPLADEEIQRMVTSMGGFIEQSLAFESAVPTNIEFRVTGGDAKLWLDTVRFEPVERNHE
jgi:hypothetical protein